MVLNLRIPRFINVCVWCVVWIMSLCILNGGMYEVMRKCAAHFINVRGKSWIMMLASRKFT